MGTRASEFRLDGSVHRRRVCAGLAAFRVGSHELKPNFAGVSPRALPGRLAMGEARMCFSRRSPRKKGDMLVIDNGGRNDESWIGDLGVGEAFISGIAGTVCRGTHRDTGAILAFGAKVWSLGSCPNGPLELRRGHVTALEAANLGSVTVTMDDYVFADEDGVVVVSRENLDRIVETAQDIAPGKAHRRPC